MWTGGNPSAVTSGPIVAQGTLVLEFVDRSENKVIWNGNVRQILDPEKKSKSLDLAAKAIVKLLKGFPPKGSKK
jgi:capsid protein